MDVIRSSRRKFLIAASGVSMAPVLGRPVAARTRKKDWETWESQDATVSLKWDPEFWEVAFPDSTLDDFSMALYDVEKNGGDGYFFEVKLVEKSWESLDDAAGSASDDWFAQGMNGSVIVEEFQTRDACGWLHYNDFQQNPRSFSLLEYSPVEPGNRWLELGMSLDETRFDEDLMEELLDSLRLNDQRVPWAIDADDLIDLIENNLRD
jgi:hypothetical protein